MISLKFPNNFTSNNFYTIFADLSNKIVNVEFIDEIVIDLSELKYVDTEGTNYIILIPVLISSLCKKIHIIVPLDLPILRYLQNIGAIKILEGKFYLHHLVTSNNTKKYTYGDSPLSKYQETYFVDNLNITEFLQRIGSKYQSWVNTDVLHNISLCVFELLYNVLEHSGTNFGSISIFFRRIDNDYYFNMTVSDIGLGIRKTMMNSHVFQNVKSIERIPDEEFVIQALKKGISSTNELSRGMGLFYVSMIADSLTITTGQCRVHTKKDIDLEISNPSIKQIPAIKGTSIGVGLKLSEESIRYLA
jgi:hypothetical protein